MNGASRVWVWNKTITLRWHRCFRQDDFSMREKFVKFQSPCGGIGTSDAYRPCLDQPHDSGVSITLRWQGCFRHQGKNYPWRIY